MRAMAARTALATAMTAMLAGCAHYHVERSALRMAYPNQEPRELAAYSPPNADYPSVGGDILKGTAPNEQAAYEAGAHMGPPNPEIPPPIGHQPIP